MLKVPKTFYSLQSIGRILGIPADTIKDAYRGKELDSIQAIAPIAHLFRRFEEGEEFSYAILKSHFERWRNTGKVPKVSSGRPPVWKNDPSYENLNIPIKKSLYTGKLKKVVDNANKQSVVKLTYRDAVYIAIEEFCMRRPEFLGGGDDAGKQE